MHGVIVRRGVLEGNGDEGGGRLTLRKTSADEEARVAVKMDADVVSKSASRGSGSVDAGQSRGRAFH